MHEGFCGEMKPGICTPKMLISLERYKARGRSLSVLKLFLKSSEFKLAALNRYKTQLVGRGKIGLIGEGQLARLGGFSEGASAACMAWIYPESKAGASQKCRIHGNSRKGLKKKKR